MAVAVRLSDDDGGWRPEVLSIEMSSVVNLARLLGEDWDSDDVEDERDDRFNDEDNSFDGDGCIFISSSLYFRFMPWCCCSSSVYNLLLTVSSSISSNVWPLLPLILQCCQQSSMSITILSSCPLSIQLWVAVLMPSELTQHIIQQKGYWLIVIRQSESK